MSDQVSAEIDSRRERAASSGWLFPLTNLIAILCFAALLGLGVTNMVRQAAWNEVEDGVLWVAREEGVVAAELAPGSAASGSGLRLGDILLAIDGVPIERPADVARRVSALEAGASVEYTVLRMASQRLVNVTLVPSPKVNLPLYYVLASVGILSLAVGFSVRLRRPRDPATLHFLWLAIAFYGTFTFSFAGRFDRLDWVFYWADAIAQLVLPPLFLHFTLVFPERPGSWARTSRARWLPLLYAPAALLGGLRAAAILRGSSVDAKYWVGGVVQGLDLLEPLHLSIYLGAALIVLLLAFRQVRSLTARRQLRWIAWGTLLGGTPFAVAYAMPFLLGVRPTIAMQLTAIPLGIIPLAFASAIIRYRLMDVEVIIKRMLVYAAAVAAILVIYALLLRAASLFPGESQHNSIVAMLATLVVVLLARPVKAGIQATFDRAFYRDRYDYRRALVGFARDLTTDLDLNRLSDRLVSRVMETLLVERMALMLADDEGTAFSAIRTAGFTATLPVLPASSALGTRLAHASPVALDDPFAARPIPAEDVEFWREQELYYFVPCVSKSRTRAVLALGRKTTGEPLSSEDVALLTAVAAQVATALENGRLYRQLRLQAEEVDRMREFNESILESLDAGLVVVANDGRIVRWNRALERLYGLSRAEVMGRGLRDVFPADFAAAIEGGRRETSRGTTLSRLSLASRVQGREPLLVNVTTMPLQRPAGEDHAIAGTIVIIADVTARVRLEEQLQIAEKMASIGMLAAGVAHEVNTPLTGISSYTQMLLEGSNPDDPRTQLLEKIERQTFRAAKIVNGLLNLSRPASAGGGEPGPVDLNAVVNDVLALLEHQLKVANIQVRRDLASPSPVVLGIEYKLQQVFLNLFLNARDAMPKGGWLSVSTRSGHEIIEAMVADTGGGIPREHLSRIYDPFFTTKATGQGTGLGLSITYGIVREHDGTIDCQSSPGEGTRFRLAFPAASAAVHRSGRVAN